MANPEWLKKMIAEGRVTSKGVNYEALTPVSRAFVKGQEDMLAAVANNSKLINFGLVLNHIDPAFVQEDYFQEVFEAATISWGWWTFHFRPARKADGTWSTPVSGSGAGFLDNVCVRERVVYAELKREDGELTFEQAKLVERLQEAREEVYVWKPSDWKDIVTIMQHPRSDHVQE
jgi:hypothetical protein